MNHFIANLICSTGHKAAVPLYTLTKEQAHVMGSILDGTSTVLLGNDAVLGKCSLCGKPLRCSVAPGPSATSDPDHLRRAAEQGFSGQ